MTTLDTHQAVKAIAAAGLPEGQAEAIVNVIKNQDFSRLATRQDLSEFKAEIVRWMSIQTLAIVGAVVAVVKLL